MANARRWAHDEVHQEEGQAIAELVIVAPVLLLVIVLLISLGRIDSAQGDVESAARAGVQAAVVQDNPSRGPGPGCGRSGEHVGHCRAHVPVPAGQHQHLELHPRGLGVSHRDLCHQPGRRVDPRRARHQDAVGHLLRPHRPVPGGVMNVTAINRVRINTERASPARLWLVVRGRGEDGQFLAMTVVFMTMFLALAGLVADGGRYFDAKQAAASEAEQAARAGAGLPRRGPAPRRHRRHRPRHRHHRGRELHDRLPGTPGAPGWSGNTVYAQISYRQPTQLLGIIGVSSLQITVTESATDVTGVTTGA